MAVATEKDADNATAAAPLENLVPSWLLESKPAHKYWACLGG
jgi:hypothetical protein